MTSSRRLAPLATLAAAVLLTACASLPQTPAEKAEARATKDPFESVNRVVFDVNDFLDRLLIRPLAELYRVTVPPPLRDRVANILGNMSEPVILANNILQGEFGKAKITFERLTLNTTLGVGGMFEVASGYNLPQQEGDFGQTLYTWGIEDEGPYLILPLLGPSNFRDGIGLGVDSMMSPWKYAVRAGDTTAKDTFFIADTGMSGLTRREANIEGIDALREGSLDFYAQMRSVYRQHRAKQLGQPLASDAPQFDDYETENQSAPILH